MTLPKLKFLKELPFTQKVSLLSLGILVLVLPFLAQSAQTRTEMRKRAQTPTSPPGPVAHCDPKRKAIITLNRSNDLQSLSIAAVAGDFWNFYSRPGFKITTINGHSYFTDKYPTSLSWGSGFLWNNYYMYSTKIPYITGDFKIEFYVNHTPYYNDGEPCGEYTTMYFTTTPTPTPSASCPSFHPCYRTFYGSVKINGNPAPIGTDVKAYSPRSELVGCGSVNSQFGDLPFMRVFGTEAGYFSGMNVGERITFKINNNIAFTSPGPIPWSCDSREYDIVLELTPTPPIQITPTPTFTPTPRPTILPTIRPTSAPVVTCPGACCKGDYGSCNTRLLSPFNADGSVNDSGGCNPSKVYPGTWCCRSCR